MAANAVLWTVDPRGVAEVTLNRPDRNNAYDGSLLDGLHTALDALETERGLRAVVIRGAGRHFQAGADLDWLTSVRDGGVIANEAASRRTAEAVERLDQTPVPTIARVQGACIGGGTGLLAATDVVIAEETATFAISEVRWGLTAAIIVPHLVRAIGSRQARRYALTAERFTASEAQRIGLVHEIVAPGGLDLACASRVSDILKNAPGAIAETKAQIRSAAASEDDADMLNTFIAEHSAKRQSEEAGEGLASFKEKRPAHWQPADDA
ncbi:MAG: enoyl-CoA hydratase-related protein [Pseudomonadota bacterium]